MPTIDFGDAKAKIVEIAKIAETCPESLREKCFELLFGIVFADMSSLPPKPAAESVSKTIEADDSLSVKSPPVNSDYKPPANILVFTRKYEVSFESIQKLFILDHEPLLPVYKITSKIMATAQLQKVMMILLENGLLSNQLKAPYTELRDSIKEAGLMDGNFNKILKKNSILFRGAVTKDKIIEGESIELTGPGYERLAQVIKELSQPVA